MASVRGLTPEAIKALIEDSKRDYKVVRESLTTMYRRYEGLDADLDHLSQRMDSLPDEIKDSLDNLLDLDEVLAAAREEVDSLRKRFPIKGVDIADDAITANKIEAGAITALQIVAGAVTTEKLAAGAVVAEKIDAKAVTAQKLAADSVTAGSIAADSVLTRHIGTEQVTAEKLKAGSVEAEKIAAGAVTSDSIAAGSITADNIEAGAFKLRPNSILPDSAFGNFPPKNSTATAENPMPGLSKDVHGYRPEETDGLVYIPFSRPVEISTDGRYSLDMDVYLDSTQQQFNGVYVLLAVEGVDDEELVIKATGTIDGEDDAGYVGSEVIPTPPDQDAPSGIPVGTSLIVLSASPGSDYKYDHTNIKIDFELVSSEGLKTLKVHGFTPSVRGILTRFDILAHAPTMKDLEDAQRATQMFAEDLSAAMGQLSTNLTTATRELSEIRREVSTPTSFMLIWPGDRREKNDVSIAVGSLSTTYDKLVLYNGSNRPVAYTSTVSASYTDPGQSDVVRSGIVAPKSEVPIGPDNYGDTPASALVEPLEAKNFVIEEFNFEFTESDREVVNGKPDPKVLQKDILMLPSKDILAVALEVIEGLWGNDPERSIRLREAGYDPEVVQRVVNGLIPQHSKLERPDAYERLAFSADVVVPQVGSWLAATTVEVYLLLWTKYKGYNSVFARVVEQSQRAGSFGTHRFNVSYNLNYEDRYPYGGYPDGVDSPDLEVEYELFQLRVRANNENGRIIGTTASGGITVY